MISKVVACSASRYSQTENVIDREAYKAMLRAKTVQSISNAGVLKDLEWLQEQMLNILCTLPQAETPDEARFTIEHYHNLRKVYVGSVRKQLSKDEREMILRREVRYCCELLERIVESLEPRQFEMLLIVKEISAVLLRACRNLPNKKEVILRHRIPQIFAEIEPKIENVRHVKLEKFYYYREAMRELYRPRQAPQPVFVGALAGAGY